MGILDNAANHFKEKIAGKKVEIKVPEWSNDNHKCVLYMRPLSCCSVGVSSKIGTILAKGDNAGMVDIIMMLATDTMDDKNDKYVFQGANDKIKLLNKVDFTVVKRIFDEWLEADEEDLELKK